VSQLLDGAPVGSRTGPPVVGRLWRELAQSFRNPEFWALSSWLDILVRTRRSYLGPLWLLMPSLVYVFGLGSFFASLHGRTMVEFAAYVALGAIVFRTLMSAVIGSASVFNASHAFIMDGHMRLTDYLLQSLAKSFFDLLMFLPVTVVALAIYPGLELSGLLLAVPSAVLIYINVLWMSVVFSLIGARFPDFAQLLPNVSVFIFLLTPIIWYAEMAPPESLRGQFMRLNPFYHLVALFRAPILGMEVEPLSYWYVGAMTVVGLLVATLLYRRYARFVPLWV
jgi:ABC-2 type transport system permease protein